MRKRFHSVQKVRNHDLTKDTFNDMSNITNPESKYVSAQLTQEPIDEEVELQHENLQQRLRTMNSKSDLHPQDS